MNPKRKRPVMIVTGFLGSGKTTLLRHLLARPDAGNVIVIVNEYGREGLDHHLLTHTREQTKLLAGGCLCCSLRKDLAAALSDFLDQEQRGEIPPPDLIVIETSGLADPAPIHFTIAHDPVLKFHFEIRSVVTVVDAIAGEHNLRRHPEAQRQVAVADTIVVSKTDLAETADTDRLRSRLTAVNAAAAILDSKRVSSWPMLFPAIANWPRMSEQGADTAPLHPADLRTLTLVCERPLDWSVFGIWLSMLLHARGTEILRVKGMIDAALDGPVVLDGVQHTLHPPRHWERWPDGERVSKLVFIAKGIEPFELKASLDTFQQAFAERRTGANGHEDLGLASKLFG